ncbi:MAG: DUF364 domain-containing protein [Desulfuromonadaceae bacterium]|nr:DUF364 domain-containing protein [Desulfuromonadaceae bacterium]
MKLNQQIFDLFRDRAQGTVVEQLCMGLGYTAVSTSDGGVGIAYTYFDAKTGCMMHEGYENPEGKPAVCLLEKIFSDIPLQRAMALATVNALNFSFASDLPEERDNNCLVEEVGIGKGTHVAMVGLFKPLIRLFESRGAQVEVHDIGKGIGAKEGFYEKLNRWADVVIMTSTTLLNNTTEEILSQVGEKVRTVLVGPGTPMIREAFRGLPVHFLAGMVPVDKGETFRAVRHGTGTPIIQKFGRKVLLKLK